MPSNQHKLSQERGWSLTYWGPVTHICVSRLTVTGSDNGLSPGRRQAIIWTNAGILLIRTLGTNFSEIPGKAHSFSYCGHQWLLAEEQRGTLRWRHNGLDSVSNHQPHDCLLNRLFKRRSKKTSKLCVTGLCAGNSPGTGEFPAQMASYAENVSIWWRHHDL